MTFHEIVQRLVAEFGESVVVESNPDTKDPWVAVTLGSIVEVARFLKHDPSLQFNMLCDLTAVDYLETDPKLAPRFPYQPHLEVVYQLQSLTLKHRLTLKVKIPRWKNDVEGELPEVPSLSSVWAIANWHEREAYDLMGIQFTGHPNLTRILCVEDWVGHPLRKDYEFPLEYHGVRGR